jgi:hypothetical protein
MNSKRSTFHVIASVLATLLVLGCRMLSAPTTVTANPPTLASSPVPATAAPTEPPATAPAASDTSSSGELLAHDSFDDDSNDWRTGDVDGQWWTGTRLVKDGVLEFNGTSKRDMVSYVVPGNEAFQSSAADEVVKVEVKMPDATMNGGAGLIVRADSEEDNLYILQLDANGYFAFFLLEGNDWTTLIDWTQASHFNPGDWNEMSVEAVGSHFRLFINGYQDGEVDDSTLASGRGGVIAYVHDANVKILVQFDNFEVRRISSPATEAAATDEPEEIAPGTGSIHGSLTNWDDAGSVASRHLVLCRMTDAGSQTVSDCVLQERTVNSDAEGAFQFDEVDSGDYYIIFDTGFPGFAAAVNKWKDQPLQLSDPKWVTMQYCGSADGNVTVYFLGGMSINQESMQALVQALYVCDSAFALALDPQGSNNAPLVVRVRSGTTNEVDFKVADLAK